MNTRVKLLLPFVLAFVLLAGMYLGYRFNTIAYFNSISVGNSSKSKIDQVVRFIEKKYVDTVNEQQLVDKTLTAMLQTLDPHSSYIPVEELEGVNEQLQGEFDGIGIEFNLIKDTIRVIAAISGGPSEAVGIQAGDRVVSVDGRNVAGIKIKSKEVVKNLRGKAGTIVKVGIQRPGVSKPLQFTITRGKIPIYSVDVAYMATPSTGYIKVNRFAEKTYEECIQALDKLSKEGMKSIIIDLRDNPGGFLQAAVELADEFLPEGKMIVYTEGRAHAKEEFKSTANGSYEKNKLVVLIDEGSASASEIVAGALQDNDRGTIVGRRSYGKGLVQSQTALSDGSAIRLTVARYYTPVGRCIQKPYNGDLDDYYNEESNRYKKGELMHADSIKFVDSLKFITAGGKTVYGGGGIMPDIFIPLDTMGRTTALAELLYSGMASQFIYEYADDNRKKLKEYTSQEDFAKRFTISSSLFQNFIAFAEKNGAHQNHRELQKSETLIKQHLKALLARNLWGIAAYYYISNENDPAFKVALQECSKP